MDESATSAVGHIVGAEGNKSVLRSGHMNAASLQTFQINVPCVLESHSRNAKRMGLDLIKQDIKRINAAGGGNLARILGRQGNGCGVFPVPPDILAGSFCRILPDRPAPFIPGSCRQSAVFSQHGECRK